ncbi:MAG TPA: hypothetical protein VKD72_15055 [Gemmataceae bacterium]|nr:hypothetical protein [Gemmataceae bacterium]
MKRRRKLHVAEVQLSLFNEVEEDAAAQLVIAEKRATWADDLPEYLGWWHPDPEYWRDIRRRCFERDGWKCRVCSRPNDLVCHHRTYDHWGHEWLSELTTLCRVCHRDAHRRGRLAS